MSSINHNIHPSKKDKKWISESIKTYYNQFIGSAGMIFYNNRTRYNEIRSYMLGLQDTSKYVSQVIPTELANDDKTWERVNFEVFPLIPKQRRIILDILKKMRYEINVEVIDALAMDDQAKYFADIGSRILMRQKLAEAGLNQDFIQMKPSEPKDFDELEVYMKYSYKHQAAIEIETALDLIRKNKRYDDIRDRVEESLFDFNLAVVREYQDYDGELVPEYIDLKDFVCDGGEDPNFSDMTFAGEIKLMSISQIANYCDKGELAELNELKEEMEDGHTRMKGRAPRMMDNKVRVLRMEFLSPDEKEFEVRRTKDGGLKFGYRSGGKKNKEFKKAHYDSVYAGYWVIDSDFYFSCKKETNMKRDHDDLKVTRLSYHPVAIETHNGHTKSIGEQLMPLADAACIAWYKLQNAILRAKPKGVMWELTSLQDINIGDEEITPDQNILMYNLTGNLAYRRIDEDGDVANWNPITELEGGIGTQGQEYVVLLQQYFSFARDITGLNEVAEGSTPDPKMLKTVAEAARASANNAVRHLHEAEKRITSRVMTDLMIRLQDKAQDGTIDMYTKALGQTSVKFFKLSKNTGFRRLGIFFEPEPAVEDKQKLEQRLQIALQSNAEGVTQITLEDANFVDTIRNPKAALDFLAFRVRKNREEMEAAIAKRDQSNTERNIQAAQSAEEAKRETAKFEMGLELEKMKAQFQYDLRIEKAKAGVLLRSEGIKAEARDRENIRTNETKRTIESEKAEKQTSTAS